MNPPGQAPDFPGADGLLVPDGRGGFHYEGAGHNGRIGVVVSHGFTGTPYDVLPWAQALAEHGYAVKVPLLPGHGTSWQDLRKTSWKLWASCYEEAFMQLRAHKEFVIAAGLSMGGTLALRTGALHGADGVLVVNPALTFYDWRVKVVGVLKYFMPTTAPVDEGTTTTVASAAPAGGGDYAVTPLAAVHQLKRLFVNTRRKLTRLNHPVLVFKSQEDLVVPANTLELIRAAIAPESLEVIRLPRSSHVATLDVEIDVITAGSIDFITKVSGP